MFVLTRQELSRVDGLAAFAHFEMELRCIDAAAHTDAGDYLAARDHIAARDQQFIGMGVGGNKSRPNA